MPVEDVRPEVMSLRIGGVEPQRALVTRHGAVIFSQPMKRHAETGMSNDVAGIVLDRPGQFLDDPGILCTEARVDSSLSMSTLSLAGSKPFTARGHELLGLPVWVRRAGRDKLVRNRVDPVPHTRTRFGLSLLGGRMDRRKGVGFLFRAGIFFLILPQMGVFVGRVVFLHSRDRGSGSAFFNGGGLFFHGLYRHRRVRAPGGRGFFHGLIPRVGIAFLFRGALFLLRFHQPLSPQARTGFPDLLKRGGGPGRGLFFLLLLGGCSRRGLLLRLLFLLDLGRQRQGVLGEGRQPGFPDRLQDLFLQTRILELMGLPERVVQKDRFVVALDLQVEIHALVQIGVGKLAELVDGVLPLQSELVGDKALKCPAEMGLHHLDATLDMPVEFLHLFCGNPQLLVLRFANYVQFE